MYRYLNCISVFGVETGSYESNGTKGKWGIRIKMTSVNVLNNIMLFV
jgi:hypothetical protein